MLATLGRETLKGEGDVVKHLAYFGVAVTHEQQELEEFDFTVNNIDMVFSADLRLILWPWWKVLTSRLFICRCLTLASTCATVSGLHV